MHVHNIKGVRLSSTYSERLALVATSWFVRLFSTFSITIFPGAFLFNVPISTLARIVLCNLSLLESFLLSNLFVKEASEQTLMQTILRHLDPADLDHTDQSNIPKLEYSGECGFHLPDA